MPTKSKSILFKITSNILWFFSLLVIIFVLLLSLVKLALPYLINDKSKIESYLEQQLGGDVRYQNLTVDWSKFKPIIQFKNFKWQNLAKTVSVDIEQGYIELALWQTLYKGHLQTEEISLQGVVGQAQANEQQGTVTELLSIEQIARLFELHPEMLEQKNVEIKNSRISIKQNSQDLIINFPLITFEKVKHQRQLIIETHSKLFKRGRIVAESTFQPFSAQGLISIYTKFDDVDVDQLTQHFDYEKGLLNKSSYTGWFNFQGKDLSDSVFDVLGFNNDYQHPVLDARVRLSNIEQQLKLSTEKLLITQLQQDDWQTHSSAVALEATVQDGVKIWRVNSASLPLNYFLQLAFPLLPNALQKVVIENTPNGDIQTIDLELLESEQGLQPLQANIQIENITLSASEQLPGTSFDKLSINKSSKPLESHLWKYQLTSQDNTLAWPSVFLNTIDLHHLTAFGSFEIRDDFLLNIDHFSFANEDATAQAHGFIAIDQDAKVELSLYAEGNDIDVSKLENYWPRNVMEQEVLSFLDEGLKAGKVDFAKMLWRGSMESFPYNDFSGQFNTQAFVKDAELKFDKEWPAATNIQADLLFDNDSLSISAKSAQLAGNVANRASAKIASLSGENSELIINARATSNVDGFRQLYQSSPLAQWLGEELSKINFSPSLTTNLKLTIPLSTDDEVNVYGEIDFNGHSITGLVDKIDLNQLQGQLIFTENGAYSKAMSANFWGSPVDFDLKVSADNEASSIAINGQSNFAIGHALEQQAIKLPIAITGNSQVNFEYYLSANKSEKLVIQSDLIGSQFKGPDWLEKDFETVAPLKVSIEKKTSSLDVYAKYNDVLSASIKMTPDTHQPINGVISLGRYELENVSRPANGVAIYGDFESINIGDWVDSVQFGQTGDFNWPSWIDSISVNTSLLKIAGQELHDVQFFDQKIASDVLHFKLNAQEGQGNLTLLPNGQKSVIVDRLDIELKPFETVGKKSVDLQKSDLQDWNFECRQCRINGFDTGLLKMQTRIENGAVVVTGDSEIKGLLQATINGQWVGQQSTLKLDFNIPDAGKLFTHWGYGDGLSQAKTQGQININWSGGFADFAISKLNGALSIDTGEGVVKELSDRQARIFSLFSLQTLRRRLSLDFSDLFGDGFFFDKINGAFSIANGIVKSEKVSIVGPAADVEISGYTNLNSQTLYQNVLVTPKISSSLPVLAGWAIEPTTGLIMFILNKIFEPVIDVVVSIKYQITGDINNPTVTEIDKQSQEMEVPAEVLEQIQQKESADDEQSTEDDDVQQSDLVDGQ